MTLDQIQKRIITPELATELRNMIKSTHTSCVYGLAGSVAAMVVDTVSAGRRSPVLVIADNADEAGYIYFDLMRLIAGTKPDEPLAFDESTDPVLMFPSGYKRDIKYGQVDAPNRIMRTQALNRWHGDKPPRVVVTYPEAMAEKVAPKGEIDSHTLHLRRGSDAVGIFAAETWLRENGFKEVDYVYEPGHFAVRGSILDIFGYSSELPLRIDYFDNEIDSIRTFNIETQLSESRLEAVDITCDVDSVVNDEIPLTDFIPDNTLVVVRDPAHLVARIRETASSGFSASAMVACEGDSNAMSHIVDPEMFELSIKRFRTLVYSNAETPVQNVYGKKIGGSLAMKCSPQGIFHKNFDLIADSFKHFLAKDYTIYILSDSAKQIERLRAIFADRGDDISFTPVLATLHEGFVDDTTHTCVFTDHQIFDRFHKYNLRSDRARSGKLALSLKELNQIEVGDYIVHIDHGIGRFAGLLRTDAGGGKIQEMIKLVYQNDDIVFVSIHSLHKLSKYRGKEGVPPKISKLGSGAWQRMKDKTKSRLKDIARDLIRLYAARKEEKGFAFAPDTYLQQELEASFIYEDTPDQLIATRDVKADMESDRPMDRLICGDVGFGKTEIAVRAAFKAATDGKQVAVLVPTTVLAYQHFHTFSERLREFPVRVEYLSRARTAKQTKEILADLAEGKIDILIGTHKIIGKDVKFRDLGLLIIDEEQKFGVATKEKLKQMKVNVDTLTMSATPIPRTLQFSLMGARDMSAITTPPPNRYPILTSVNSLNDDIISEALNFELSRNGQVFFINNRIEGLYTLENMIKRVVPDARVIIAHGQMPPEKLEKAIVDFAAHDYDILLSTTIIENGIDMPNVNTIIINNAQNFGLSELHQLRGRVGRSNRKAFCYLMVPPGISLNPDARRRLQAIESFSDLGSGIQIAMQDLDIRGAGNLLGAEQSGFIADLGYEAYQRVLREAMTELRTEEFADVLTTDDERHADERDFVKDCVIESDLELLLPTLYVPQENERINLYRELDNIERESDLDAFKVRLQDRFGRIPDAASELLEVPRLRMLGHRLGIEKIVLKMGSMYTYFVDDSNVAYYESPMFGRILMYVQQNPKRVNIREKNGKRSFVFSKVPTVSEAVKILRLITTLTPA